MLSLVVTHLYTFVLFGFRLIRLACSVIHEFGWVVLQPLSWFITFSKSSCVRRVPRYDDFEYFACSCCVMYVCVVFVLCIVGILFDLDDLRD